LRFRLERELISGAHTLERAKYEIERNREHLLPALMKARRAAAQAEKDWEAAIKRNTLKPILIVLIISFLLGNLMVMDGRRDPEQTRTTSTSLLPTVAMRKSV
jgi:hypothetical protein